MEKTMRERLIGELCATANLYHVDLRGFAPQLVDAILEELREPDEAMRDAGAHHADHQMTAHHEDLMFSAKNVFTAMIAAISADKG